MDMWMCIQSNNVNRMNRTQVLPHHIFFVLLLFFFSLYKKHIIYIHTRVLDRFLKHSNLYKYSVMSVYIWYSYIFNKIHENALLPKILFTCEFIYRVLLLFSYFLFFLVYFHAECILYYGVFFRWALDGFSNSSKASACIYVWVLFIIPYIYTEIRLYMYCQT